ncbi:hypothetical protein FOMPIDRAFT_87271 [Fomitopsis schrenkii]|uniref:Uncharacterized protein n=1 Tax=Fomitopsis schrenkii TaxID=2126942 RepID=S8DN05_FOMSC|nr:hypothetical protein FOMPIDRAFT_87271 [Fomitopsis schrenkii]
MKKLLHLRDDTPNTRMRDITPARVGKGALEWDERRLDVQCNVKALYCDENQKKTIDMIYAAKQHFAQAFTGGPQSQEKARQILQDHGLDEDSEAMLESRWKRCSQRSWERAGGLIERVVYQW